MAGRGGVRMAGRRRPAPHGWRSMTAPTPRSAASHASSTRTTVNVRLDSDDPRPIYVQIMDEIRRGIVMGALAPNTSLPSVRQLAADLRVNPNTVQQAYRELERDGVVYVQRGQGTYVMDGGVPRSERARLLKEVVARALRDATRHGITPEDLVAGIREVAGAGEEGST